MFLLMVVVGFHEQQLLGIFAGPLTILLAVVLLWIFEMDQVSRCNTRPGYDIHSSPWFFDGPNRNRWFTELNSMVDISMAMLNNQRVSVFKNHE